MPLAALLASPIFLAALSFLLSGGLDLTRREFSPNAQKPTLGEVAPVAAATAAGAVSGPVGGAIAKAGSPFLGSLTQLGLTTAAPLFARDLSAQANPNTAHPPSLAQVAQPSAPQQLVNQYQQNYQTASQLPLQYGQSTFPQSTSPQPAFPQQGGVPPLGPVGPSGELTSADQIRQLYFSGQ